MEDLQKAKEELIKSLAVLDMQITEEDIKNASKEDLLKYLELTEKIKARLDIL